MPMRKFIMTVVVLALTGCGVESGNNQTDNGDPATDLSQTVIQGRLTDSAGRPLLGATIIDSKSGDQTSADAEGRFSMLAVIESGAAEIIVETDGVSAHATFTDLFSDTPVSATLRLSADRRSFTVTITNDAGGGLTPTPSPTPSASTGTDTFDSQGNTTGFSIPRGTTGNAHQGKSIYVRECGACHTNRRGAGQDFNALRHSVGLPVMGIKVPGDISTSDFADIVAYLNFR